MTHEDILVEICAASGVEREVALRVTEAALQALHRHMVIDDQGSTGVAMDLLFTVSSRAAFCFLGVLATEHDYAGNEDCAGLVDETARRLLPGEQGDAAERMKAWLAQRAPARQEFDKRARFE